MKFSKKFISLTSFVVLVIASTAVFAFSGPPSAPPTGDGVLKYIGNKLGVGGDPSGQTTYATIFSPNDFAFGLKQGSGPPVIFKAGTDGALVVNANSSDTFTVKNGNVGIGESSPTQGKLVVKGGNFPATLLFGYGQQSTAGAFSLKHVLDNNYTFDIASGGLAKLTIDNSDPGANGKLNLFLAPTGGTVGIGTASPDTNVLLDVAGKIKLSGSVVNDNRITNVDNPVDPKDVATRGWVEIYVAAQSGGSSGGNDSLTANAGMYSNKIPNMTPPNAYAEICFKSTSPYTFADKHTISEPTTGGNCSPGDTGFIVENNVRLAGVIPFPVPWESARRACTTVNMRLLEPFEWKLACKSAASWGLSNMGVNYEWASNSVFFSGSNAGAFIIGNGACDKGATGVVAGGSEDSYLYRCAR